MVKEHIFRYPIANTFHDDLFSNTWFLNWWVWGPDAFGLCGIAPNPTDQPGPMCLEGLEEASGESSSESLKKSGRQFEAVGQGAVPVSNLFWFWGGFFEMGWFVEFLEVKVRFLKTKKVLKRSKSIVTVGV